MNLTSLFAIKEVLSKVFSFVSGNNTSAASQAGPTDMSAADAKNFITENERKVSLGMAIAMAYSDGDDGIFFSTLKGIMDYFAINDVTDGDSNFISELYLSTRSAKITAQQTGSGVLGLFAGIATYFGIGAWENNMTAQPAMTPVQSPS